jgi:hypothetical protein
LQQENTVNSINEAPPRTNELKRFFKVFLGRGLVVFGLFIIVLFVVTAIFSPQIAPYDPLQRNLSEALQQPSGQHLLGTDALGRIPEPFDLRHPDILIVGVVVVLMRRVRRGIRAIAAISAMPPEPSWKSDGCAYDSSHADTGPGHRGPSGGRF